MKDKILQAIKKGIIDPKTGKTSVNDTTLNAFVELVYDKITDETQIEAGVAPFIAFLKNDVQGNINSVAADAVKNVKPVKETEQKTDAPKDDLDSRLSALLDAKLKPLQDKLSEYESKESKTTRQTTIAEKCKTLGIPEWRQKEGFALADDADEATIDTYLTSVKQNITTNGLPAKDNGLTISTSEKQLEEIAKASVSNLPDIKP